MDDVIARLTTCGLGEKEARAFAHLTHLGATKVTEVATAAGLKRAETYQVLERLQSRGLVEATLSRPRQFTAISPERAVATLVEEREQALHAIESMKDDLVARLARIGGDAAEAGAGEAFRVLHDRNQIVGQLTRTLRAATAELCVVASSRSLFRLLLDEGLDGEFRSAQKRGVNIRILTEVLPGQEDQLERLIEFADVRHLMVPRPLRFFIADEREIVQYVTADPMGGASKETALWLGARDHVQAQRAFFDDLWNAAMAGRARLQELATGRAPEQVQVVQGRFTRYEKEKEVLLRAQREVALVLPGVEAARLKASGIQRVLVARLAEGTLRVRILAQRGSKVSIQGADVREADLENVLPMVVSDHAEGLLVFPGAGQVGESVTGVEEYGVWVTLAPTVESLAQGFEERWNDAA
ncbi:MAG: helix-turn-helix domain-containing protein [Candidatus Thermoplasmatota archaeon]